MLIAARAAQGLGGAVLAPATLTILTTHFREPQARARALGMWSAMAAAGGASGAVLGGLVMGIAEVMVVGYVSPTYRDAIAFVLLIVILLVRPSGILGRSTTEKV